MDFEDIQSEENTTYEKGIASMKQIVLLHIRKICEISSQEMTKGYWQTKPINTGSGVVMSKVYKPDLRLSYIEAVNILSDIVTFDSKSKIFKEKSEAQFKKDAKENYTVEENLKDKRILFREINKMFDETNYFKNTEAVSE